MPTRQILIEKQPKNGQKLIFFRNFLGITKYHQNTCLCEILGLLEHFWAQNGHFKAFFGPFWPLLLYRGSSPGQYTHLHGIGCNFLLREYFLKIGQKLFFSEKNWESLNTIRIHVCVEFQANWSTFGANMAIFRPFLAHFGQIQGKRPNFYRNIF